MHLQVTGQITVNAPADKVWRIVAHDFGGVGRWASAIPQSEAVTDLPAIDGAAVCGRVCSTAIPGFRAVREQFTHYDERAMRFGYQAINGRPAFITHAENNWLVRALTPSTCTVEVRGELDLRPFPGVFLVPLLKLQMNRTGAQHLEELKYYVEHDQPHPRKLKALRK